MPHLRNVMMGLSALTAIAAPIEAAEPPQIPEPERNFERDFPVRPKAPPESEDGALRRFQAELVRAVGRIVSERDYPREARNRGWQGSTMLRLEIGADGVVKAVSVKRSSGYSILDERAVSKLRSVTLPEIPDPLRERAFSVDVPFRFSLKTPAPDVEPGDIEIDPAVTSASTNLSAANDALKRYRTLVTYLMASGGLPQSYPPEAQQEGWESSTTVRLRITPDGRLKDVTVAKSSGYSILDDFAVSKSRTVTLPDIPEALRGLAFNINVPIHFRFRGPAKQEAGVVMPGPTLK